MTGKFRDDEAAKTGAQPKLDALKILLASARELTDSLTDPTIGRVLRAMARLPPDDRETLAAALERAAAARSVGDSIARISGTRLRIHPNPRLFVRVVDTAEPAIAPAFEPDDVLPETLRIMRRVHLVLTPEAKAVWHPVVEEAAGLLSARELEACVALMHQVIDLVTPGLAKQNGSSRP